MKGFGRDLMNLKCISAEMRKKLRKRLAWSKDRKYK